MGFRSTFSIEDWGITWPEWFVDKWGEWCWFRPDHKGTFSPKREGKAYTTWIGLPEDIQRAMDWSQFSMSCIVLVYLHECGGITRCQISKDTIRWSEPDSWRETDNITHDYCYGCSDLK